MRTKEAPRAGRRRKAAAPGEAPFRSFLDRDGQRQARQRGRKRTLIISLGIHVVVFGALLGWSLFEVDDLMSPTVEVKVFTPAKLPAGVATPPAPAPVMP